MRLVEVTLSPETEEAALDILQEEGINYRVTDEVSEREYTLTVSFPLPTNAVEPILDKLKDTGVPESAFTVVVAVETVVSEDFDALQERYGDDGIQEERIARQELQSQAEDLTPVVSIFLAMTIISAVVATVGLLLDSPAIVVGSMVIAPLIGPALAASVGTVVDDRSLFIQGVKYQILGLGAAITSAAIFAWLLQTLLIIPPGIEITDIDELHARVAPDLLSLPVAIAAGIAGVLSLSTGISVALVGVMIAAALIPPAAAAGIAIAWGLPTAALGSIVLVLLNLLSINIAGLLTLWYTGYRPSGWREVISTRRRMVMHVVVIAVFIVGLSAFLTGVTFTTYQLTMIEQDAHAATEDALESGEYEALELLAVEVEMHGEELPFQWGPSLDAAEGIDQLVIEIGAPPGETDPELVDTLYERINEDRDDEIAVQVRFVLLDEVR